MKCFTISEVSKITGKSRQWIWTLIRMNRLPAEKIGNQYVIKESDLRKSISRPLTITAKLNSGNNNE